MSTAFTTKSLLRRCAPRNDPFLLKFGTRPALPSVRHAVKKFDNTRLQRILRTDDEQTFLLNQLFENFRPVAQMIRGRTYISPNGERHQRIVTMSKFCREQWLNRWPDTVNDRVEIF